MLDHPVAIDPLSDVLARLRAQAMLTASLETAGDWAIRFAAYEPGTLKFSAVVRGRCWLQVEQTASNRDHLAVPIVLQAGDCVLLNGPPGYTLASDLSLPSVEASVVYADAPDRRARYGETGADGYETHLIGGSVRFDWDAGARLLLDSLPPVIVVHGASDAASAVRWLLQTLAAEAGSPRQIGSASVTGHLAHLLFVQVLRAHLAAEGLHDMDRPPDAGGWIGAAAHPRIGLALGLMHSDPSRRWTLPELATAAGLSRSTFSERFKAMVGRAPMDYLLHWRVQRAQIALRESTRNVAAIAFDTGYESESAFSSAFKRVVGQSPAHYRRAWRVKRSAV